MEFLDIIDENDNVIGAASKAEVYEKRLMHRIVHVFVLNNKNKMALQLQGKNKKFCPLHWVTAAAGHVQSGESWEEAAAREMKEEIGIEGNLLHSYKDVYHDPSRNFKKIISSFAMNYDGSFKLNPYEVADVKFFTIEEIKDMIANGEKFHPELLFLLKKHFF